MASVRTLGTHAATALVAYALALAWLGDRGIGHRAAPAAQIPGRPVAPAPGNPPIIPADLARATE